VAQSATKQAPSKAAASSKTYVISLENRKARGSGHERPEEILAAARAFSNMASRM
jgi:hypothetical protein